MWSAAGAANTLSGTSKIKANVTGSSSNDTYTVYACGVLCENTGSTCTMSDDSSIESTVAVSDLDYAYGISAPTLNMNGKAKFTSTISGATTHASGTAGDVLTMGDNSTIDVNVGDIEAGDGSSTLSSGIFYVNSASISGNASIKAVAGTGTEGAALYSAMGVNISVSDNASIEAISDIQAANTHISLNTVSDFMVKAGESSSTATIQDDTAKQTGTTYMDNKYVLILPYKTISSVAATDIEAPVAYSSFDTLATCETEGVKATEVVWTLGGVEKQTAEPDTEYTVEVTFYLEDNYSPLNTVATINGYNAISVEENADGSITATYKMTAVDTKLLAVKNLTDITGIDNGTAIADITLPSKVTIDTQSGDMTASVVWDTANFYSGSYNPASKEEQTFTLQGTVILPDGVEDTGAAFAAYVKVTVNAAGVTTQATTDEPTTTSTEATTTSTEATTTQAPEGSTTDTTEATTAATTEAPDNSDANVKTGDSAPLNVMIVLMLLAGIGMVVVAKKKSE